MSSFNAVAMALLLPPDHERKIFIVIIHLITRLFYLVVGYVICSSSASSHFFGQNSRGIERRSSSFSWALIRFGNKGHFRRATLGLGSGSCTAVSRMSLDSQSRSSHFSAAMSKQGLAPG